MPPRKEAKNRSAEVPEEPRAPGGPALGTAGSALSPTALGLLTAFAAAALYLPAIQYGWVWDDSFLVSTHGAGGVGAEGFRPVASLFYRIEWLLGYGTPLFAHLVSVALHAVATWLVFRLALQVGARPMIAFLAGLLFAAHPIHTEAVAYVSGRPDLLATVFALAALLLARRTKLCTPEGCRSWKIWPAYVALAAAVLSDEVAVVTPLLLMGLDGWSRTRVPWRRRLTHYSGFFAIVVVYLLVRFAAGGGSTPVPGSAHAVSGIEPGARLWALPIGFYELLKALLVPYPLNAVRALTAAEAAQAVNRIAPFAALLGIAAFALWRRGDPLARAGALLLLFPLIPALPIPGLVGSYGEERSVYFASVGFCLLVGSLYAWLWSRLPALRPVVGLAGLAVAALAGVGTLARLPVWRDNIALLQSAARADPRDPQPHLMLCEYYAADGNWPAALRETDLALRIDPKSHDALSRRAVFLSRLDRYEESAAAARQALQVQPRDALTYANLSDALVHLGRVQEGIEAARRAVEIDSTLANAWYNYGVALAAGGEAEGAIHAYQRTIALDPGSVLALNNLGALLGSTGRMTEARDLYVRLVAIAPASVEARMNLALAYLRLGDRKNASREREAVRRLNPSAVHELDQFFREATRQEAQRAGPKR